MDEFKKFIKLSKALGRRLDFVQGAGGNVSVKIGDKMFIKASGRRLKDISEKNGLAAVDYKKIAKNKIFNFSGYPAPRPSIETGFHSFLGKYVVHTHSIYANIIGCINEGKAMWRDIAAQLKISAIWINYKNPGAPLALAIKKEIKKYGGGLNKKPQAILMQNHGLVVYGEELEEVFYLHDKIQKIIQRRLKIEKFPLNNPNDYFKKFIKRNADLMNNFSKNILFPDLVVFPNDKENLIAWAYIIDCVKNCGLNLNPLTSKNVNYINNMESEKYRQKLLKGLLPNIHFD